MSINPDPTDPTAHQSPSDSHGSPWPSIRERYLHGGRSKMEARYEAVEALRAAYILLTVEETDALLRYDPETGLYREDGEDIIREQLERTLGPAFTRTEAKEILYRLKSRSRVSAGDLNAHRGYVCLLNGVLDLTDAEPDLKDHSPDYRFTSRLPVEYDPGAGCPQWEMFIEESVRSGDRLKLQEFAGYALHHWGVPFNKFGVFTGPTNSGKSTFLNAVTAVIGEEHVSNETLQRLADNKHATAQLVDKWLNTCNDLDRVSPRGLGGLKQLTAGDRTTVEPKHINPYSILLPAKHIFAANDLPDLPGDDEAFHERALHVAFPRTVPREERDPKLSDRFREEAPGILNWMLEGYARLMEQEVFTGERSPEDKEALWRSHGDSVSQFLVSGYVERGPDKKASKEDLFEAYKAYCEEGGLPRESYHAFCTRLNGEDGVGTSKPSVDGRQVPHFTGLTISNLSGVFGESREWESRELRGVVEETPDIEVADE